jgi:hypothetical protein
MDMMPWGKGGFFKVSRNGKVWCVRASFEGSQQFTINSSRQSKIQKKHE